MYYIILINEIRMHTYYNLQIVLQNAEILINLGGHHISDTNRYRFAFIKT